jgi:tetratricopeptide (TPR) repeat protein
MSRMCLIAVVAGLAAQAACTAVPPPEVDQSAARYAALRDACLQTSPPDRADVAEQKARIAACGGVISSDKTSSTDLTAALKMRARLYALAGNYADAARDYAEVVRLNPRDAPTLKVLGDTYRRLGRCALATANHDRAIRLNPKFAAAFEARADAALCLKDTSHAIEDLNQAIQLEPRSPDLYTKRGALHLQLGEETAAIDDFSQALLLFFEVVPQEVV